MVRWVLAAAALVLIVAAVTFGGLAGLVGAAAGVAATVALIIDPEGN